MTEDQDRAAEAKYKDEIVHHWTAHFVKHETDLGQSTLLRTVARDAFVAGYLKGRLDAEEGTIQQSGKLRAIRDLMLGME